MQLLITKLVCRQILLQGIANPEVYQTCGGYIIVHNQIAGLGGIQPYGSILTFRGHSDILGYYLTILNLNGFLHIIHTVLHTQGIVIIQTILNPVTDSALQYYQRIFALGQEFTGISGCGTLRLVQEASFTVVQGYGVRSLCGNLTGHIAALSGCQNYLRTFLFIQLHYRDAVFTFSVFGNKLNGNLIVVSYGFSVFRSLSAG